MKQMEGKKRVKVNMSELEGNVLAMQRDRLATEIKDRKQLSTLLQAVQKDVRVHAIFSSMPIKLGQEVLLKRRPSSVKWQATSFEIRCRLIKEHRKTGFSNTEIEKFEAQIKRDEQKAHHDAEMSVATAMLSELTAAAAVPGDVQSTSTDLCVNLRRHELLEASVLAQPLARRENLQEATSQHEKAMAASSAAAATETLPVGESVTVMKNAVANLVVVVHDLVRGGNAPAPATTLSMVVAASTSIVGSALNLFAGKGSEPEPETESEVEPEPDMYPDTGARSELADDEANQPSAALAQLSAFLWFSDELQTVVAAMPERECRKVLAKFISRVEKQSVATLAKGRRFEHEPAEVPAGKLQERLMRVEKQLQDDFPELRSAHELYRKCLRQQDQTSFAHCSTQAHVEILEAILQRELSGAELQKATEYLANEKGALAKAFDDGCASVRKQMQKKLRIQTEELEIQSAKASTALQVRLAFGRCRLEIIQQILDNGGETLRLTAAKQRAETIIVKIAEAREENDALETSSTQYAQTVLDLEKTESFGFELRCYQQVRNMLLSLRDQPAAQVIPTRDGRSLHDVDGKLCVAMIREFGCVAAKSSACRIMEQPMGAALQQTLMDTMTLREMAADVSSTCISYSEPGDITLRAMSLMCAGMNKNVKEASLDESEIRRYLRSYYAATKVQEDGLLLWMCTHMAVILTHTLDTGYFAVMDAAIKLWAQQDGVDITKGTYVPPKREQTECRFIHSFFDKRRCLRAHRTLFWRAAADSPRLCRSKPVDSRNRRRRKAYPFEAGAPPQDIQRRARQCQ